MPLLLLLFIFVPFAYGEESKPATIEKNSTSLVKAKQAASNHQWKIAEELYKKAKIDATQQGDSQKVLDILFSLLTVYQQQSDGVSAFRIAAEIEQLSANLSDAFSLTRSYRLLGIAYHSLANNALARDYYSVAVESARELNKPTLLASLLNELGYADVLVADYQSAKASFEESFQLARSENDQNLMLEAQINLLRVQIAAGNKQKIKPKFVLLERLIDEIPESEELVDKYISVGTLYRTAQIKLDLDQNYRKVAYSWYERSLKLATRYQNVQLQSISNGYIGQVYSDEAQYEIADRFTQEAIMLAQKLNNLDLVYRWTVQLARIFSVQGKVNDSLKQYTRAVDVLESLDIVSFMRYERSFNADVKPVFDEMFSLYFQNLKKITDNVSLQAELEKIIYFAEKLRFKELAAFCFGNCNIKQEKQLTTMPDNEALLYTLVTEKHLHVILKGRTNIRFKTHNISRKNLLSSLGKLTTAIQKSGSDKIYIKQAKKFYSWLISPFNGLLQKNKVKTISIVPAQELMKLPFDVLYENDRFLIENYALKYVLSSNTLKQVAKWQYSGQNVHLLKSNQSKLNLFPENRNNTKIYTNEELATLKQQILKIKSDQLFHITNKVKLANDYRQSLIIAQDENYPFFGLVNKVNSEQKFGLLLLSNNKLDNVNNLHFNSQLINATHVVAPLWSYSQKASQLLISQFNKSLQAGFNVENALQRAKMTLIGNKIYKHPKNWAALFVLQH